MRRLQLILVFDGRANPSGGAAKSHLAVAALSGHGVRHNSGSGRVVRLSATPWTENIACQRDCRLQWCRDASGGDRWSPSRHPHTDCGMEERPSLADPRSGLPLTVPVAGYEFREGESYLVYADGTEPGLYVTLCSRTVKLAQAKEDLAALGTPVTGSRHGAIVLAAPSDCEMQRTKHGSDGASPLISVFGGREKDEA